MTDLHDLNCRNDKKKRPDVYAWPQGGDGYSSCGYGKPPFETFWMCHTEGVGLTGFAYDNLDDAVKDAERLSRLPGNKGKTVYLLECVGKCKVDPKPVIWEYPEDGDEPVIREYPEYDDEEDF